MIWQSVRTFFFILFAVGLLAGFGTVEGSAQGMKLDICPADYGSFPEDAPPLTCGCSADAVKAGNVNGANPYFYQSSLCRAAMHAGAVGADGGEIVVTPEKAAFFPAVSRNGVEAGSYGEGMGFRIATAAGGTPAPASAAATSSGMTLDICPTDYGSFPEDAPPLTCGCSADAVKAGNVNGANPYFYQSSLCRAALHAGAVGADGGEIVVTPEKAAFFPAVSRNGVEAGSYGEGMGFRIATAAGGTPAPASDAGYQFRHDARHLPDRLRQLPRGRAAADLWLLCRRSEGGQSKRRQPVLLPIVALPRGDACRRGGRRWRRDRRHAGKGGVLSGSLTQRRGSRFLRRRHGISDRHGSRRHTRPRICMRATSSGMTLDICPTDYGSFPEDAPPLTCGCSADAVKAGNVNGANPYFYQSSLCRAALHAGAVGADGGEIVVTPEKAAFFPAVSRNGVEAGSYGEGMGFHVTAVPGAMPATTPPKPALDQAGKPIQAPIAETLRETGRVQLYINFATDQDKPLPSSEPILQELLATLQGDQALRVELIGHTDSQGSAPYNLDLSQRRAASVYLWLVQHGVESGRLRSDGRGLMEPIADNATDSGRALNRRVEVKAVN